MTQDEEKFAELYISKGGRLSESDPNFNFFKEFKEKSNKIIDSLENDYPDLPHIHIDIIDSNIFQASVKMDRNQQYFIGIAKGTVWAIYDMFYKMFATRSVLTELGDISVETDEEKKLSLCISGSTVEFGVFDKTIIHPNNSIRRDYGLIYSELAFRFLILHECCHIIRGHLGYISVNSKLDFFEELNYRDSILSIIGSLNSQTLEMDADSFALNRCFLYATGAIQWKGRNPSMEQNLIYQDLSSYLRHFGFVTHSIFRLFAFAPLSLENLETDAHPPPLLRDVMIGNDLYTILFTYLDKKLATKIGTEFNKGIAEAEKAFCAVTYSKPKLDELLYLSSLNNEYRTHKMKIVRNWNNVRPELEPYAFGPLPPLSTIKD